jgi:ABC-type phosphate/phosphonate transport system ATPase subunit
LVDRDRALAQVVEQAEESTRIPVVVFGPEGCGKTAFLRHAEVAWLRRLLPLPLNRVFSAVEKDSKPPFEERRRLLGAARLPWSH